MIGDSKPPRDEGWKRHSQGSRRTRCLFRIVNVLAEHDPHTVDVTHRELPEAIRLVGRLRSNLSTPTDNFLEVSVDILDPLEQVDALRILFIANEMDGGVVAPDDGVSVITEVPGKTKDVAIEGCRRRH